MVWYLQALPGRSSLRLAQSVFYLHLDRAAENSNETSEPQRPWQEDRFLVRTWSTPREGDSFTLCVICVEFSVYV